MESYKGITTSGPNIYAVIGRDEIQKEPDKNGIIDTEYDHLNTFPKELVFISITDPGTPFIITNGYFYDELKLKFWDVEEQDENYYPIYETQAKEIKDFILKHKNRKFLINCQAGVSRSAGIACAVEVLLRDKYMEPEPQHVISNVRKHWRYDINETVYNKIISS